MTRDVNLKYSFILAFSFTSIFLRSTISMQYLISCTYILTTKCQQEHLALFSRVSTCASINSHIGIIIDFDVLRYCVLNVGIFLILGATRQFPFPVL